MDKHREDIVTADHRRLANVEKPPIEHASHVSQLPAVQPNFSLVVNTVELHPDCLTGIRIRNREFAPEPIGVKGRTDFADVRNFSNPALIVGSKVGFWIVPCRN